MQQAEIASRSWTCLELAKEGERFCREGKFRDAIPLFLDALTHGTNDLSTLSAIYCQLGNAYYSTNDMQKAFSYHCYDMMIAKLMNDEVGEAKACGNIGNVLKMQNSFLDAIVFTERQLALAQQLEDEKCMARALYNLGTIHHARAKLNGKNSYVKRDQNVNSFTHKDANANADVSHNSNSSYSYHDDLNLAFQYYCRSASISRKLEDHLSTGRIYGCMGNVLHLLGDYKGAIDSHAKRLSVASQFGDHNAKHRAYINLGNAHVLLSEIDQAIVYYQSALNLAVEKNNKGREAQCCFYLASASSLKPDYPTAAGYYLRHLSLARSLKDYAGLARAYTSLAAVYTNMEKYSKAAYFLACHRALGKEMRDENMVSTAEESLKKLIDKNGRNLNIEDGFLQFDCSEDPEPQSHFCRVVNRLGNTEIKFTDQPSCMNESDMSASHNGKSVEACLASGSEFTNTDDAFFDLLSRMQSARLDEQRCDLSILTSRTNIGRRQTDSLMATQNDDSFVVIPEDRKSMFGRVRDTLVKTTRRRRKNRDNRSNTSMITDEGTNSFKGSFDSINTLKTQWVNMDTSTGEENILVVDFVRSHGEYPVPSHLETLFEGEKVVRVEFERNPTEEEEHTYSEIIKPHEKRNQGKSVTAEFVRNSPSEEENTVHREETAHSKAVENEKAGRESVRNTSLEEEQTCSPSEPLNPIPTTIKVESPHASAAENERSARRQAPEALIDLLMNAQGRRMDEQRATLLPGLNSQEQAHELIEKLGSATGEGSDSRIDDTLIDLLMRAQSQRMNEQRSELASDRKNSVDTDSPAVTTPEDDVSALVMRMQAGRFEEQRAHLRTESDD